MADMNQKVKRLEYGKMKKPLILDANWANITNDHGDDGDTIIANHPDDDDISIWGIKIRGKWRTMNLTTKQS